MLREESRERIHCENDGGLQRLLLGEFVDWISFDVAVEGGLLLTINCLSRAWVICAWKKSKCQSSLSKWCCRDILHRLARVTFSDVVYNWWLSPLMIKIASIHICGRIRKTGESNSRDTDEYFVERALDVFSNVLLSLAEGHGNGFQRQSDSFIYN